MPIFIHPSESFDSPSRPVPAKRRSIVRSDPRWHPVLAHRRFANRSDLAQVHPGNDLATDQVAGVRVGDSERIATRPIARTEVAFEVHAPELIRCRHLGEWFRVRRRTTLLPLRTGQTSSLKNVAERAGGWPLHAGFQLLHPPRANSESISLR